LPYHAQLVESVGLAGLVPDLAIQRCRPGEADVGGGQVSAEPGQNPQLTQGEGLAGAVTGAAGRFQGGPVQAGRLLPVTAGPQEVAQCRRDLYGVQRPAGHGREVRGGMQVGAFGFQPGRRTVQRRQVGDTGRRVARRRLALGCGRQHDVPPGGEGGV